MSKSNRGFPRHNFVNSADKDTRFSAVVLTNMVILS